MRSKHEKALAEQRHALVDDGDATLKNLVIKTDDLAAEVTRLEHEIERRDAQIGTLQRDVADRHNRRQQHVSPKRLDALYHFTNVFLTPGDDLCFSVREERDRLEVVDADLDENNLRSQRT